MNYWEIVAGDFGGRYEAIAEGIDLSDCVAVIKVWRHHTVLIDDKACSAVVYNAVTDKSTCTYTVQVGDFPLTAAIGNEKTEYQVSIQFTEAGFKEHSLEFTWIVYPAPLGEV